MTDRPVARASSFQLVRCNNPDCRNLHLIGLDDNDGVMADIPIHFTHVPSLVDALKETAVEIMLETDSACARKN